MPNPASGSHPDRGMMTEEELYIRYVTQSMVISNLEEQLKLMTKNRDLWEKYALELESGIEKYLKDTEHLTRL